MKARTLLLHPSLPAAQSFHRYCHKPSEAAAAAQSSPCQAGLEQTAGGSVVSGASEGTPLVFEIQITFAAPRRLHLQLCTSLKRGVEVGGGKIDFGVTDSP